MIRIIQPGRRNVSTCDDCGCKFIYESDDVSISDTFYKGYKKIVYCPQCHKEYVIEQSR